MSDAWHYKRGEEPTQGPIMWMNLQQLAAGGQLSPLDLVWNDTMLDWELGARVPGLFSALTPNSVEVSDRSVRQASGESPAEGAELPQSIPSRLTPARRFISLVKTCIGCAMLLFGFWLIGQSARHLKQLTSVPDWAARYFFNQRIEAVFTGLGGILLLFLGGLVVVVKISGKPIGGCPNCASQALRRARRAEFRLEHGNSFVIRMPWICEACGHMLDPEAGKGEIVFMMVLSGCGVVIGVCMFVLGIVGFIARLAGASGSGTRDCLLLLIGGVGCFSACLTSFRRLYNRL